MTNMAQEQTGHKRPLLTFSFNHIKSKNNGMTTETPV